MDLAWVSQLVSICIIKHIVINVYLFMDHNLRGLLLAGVYGY